MQACSRLNGNIYLFFVKPMHI